MDKLIMPNSTIKVVPTPTIDSNNPLLQINSSTSSIFVPVKAFLTTALGAYWPMYFWFLAVSAVAVKTKSFEYTAIISIVFSALLTTIAPPESRILLTVISFASVALAVVKFAR